METATRRIQLVVRERPFRRGGVVCSDDVYWFRQLMVVETARYDIEPWYV
jgi:hypothetical protein